MEPEIKPGDTPAKKFRFFYGWWIVLAGFFFVACGTGIIRFITRLDFLVKELGSDIDKTAIALAIFTAGITVASLATGPLIDRFGPRKLMLIGIPLAGIALLIPGFVDISIYIPLVILALGMGAGLQLPVQTATANWFIKRRSIALAVICAAPVVGRPVVKLLGNRITDHFSFQNTLLGCGALLLVIGIPAALAMKHKPEDHSEIPDGATANNAEEDKSGIKKASRLADMNFSLRQAMKTKVFWILVVAVGFVSGSRVLAESSRGMYLLDQGVDGMADTSLFEPAPLMGLAWIILFGFLGDRFSKRYLLAVAATLQSISAVMLMTMENTTHIYLYMLVYGFGSAITPLILAIRADYFGRKAFATITVVMGIFSAILSVGFVFLNQVVFSQRENYQTAFLLSMIIGLAAAMAFIFARPPELPQQNAANHEMP